MGKLPNSRIILDNEKIKVIEKYFMGRNNKILKKFLVIRKGKVNSKLGKTKHTEVLDENEFWKFMENYLDDYF